MKVTTLGKTVEGTLTDTGMMIFDKLVIGQDGVLFDEVELAEDVTDNLLVADLDKVAKAIKLSDKIDGYHAMNKENKIKAINENR